MDCVDDLTSQAVSPDGLWVECLGTPIERDVRC